MTDSTTSSSPVRQWEGLDVPAAGTFVADPTHSTIGFVGRHLMVSKVRGRCGDFDATAVIAEDPLQSTLEVSVRMASLDTGSPDRDAHLRSPDFFDVERYPLMAFRSTRITHVGGDRVRVEGDLTIRDVTRPLTLDAEWGGVVSDPWGMQRFGVEATAEVEREDWGLSWNVALETGGWLVSKKVKLEIDAEFVRQPEGDPSS